MARKKGSKNIKTKVTEPIQEQNVPEYEAKTEPETKKDVFPVKTEDLDCPWLPNKAHFRVDEVARYFDITEQTIKTWIAHGHFPGTLKTEGPYRIPREGILHCKNRFKLNDPEKQEAA